MLKLRFGDTHTAIQIPLTEWLAAYNLDLTQRTAAIVVIKERPTDADEAALFTGDDEDGAIQVVGDLLLVRVLDYQGLLPRPTYSLAIGIKWAADTHWREVPLADHRIQFEQDYLRA